MEILIGEFLVGTVAAAVLVWGYSLFLLVAPDERQCVGGATAEFSGLEQLPRPLGVSSVGASLPTIEGSETVEFVNADLGRGEPLEDGFKRGDVAASQNHGAKWVAARAPGQ